MNEVRIVGNDLIISVDEVTATIENAALIEDNKRLQAENAKLRELCGELYEDQCDECDCWKYRDRMRELGVDA